MKFGIVGWVYKYICNTLLVFDLEINRHYTERARESASAFRVDGYMIFDILDLFSFVLIVVSYTVAFNIVTHSFIFLLINYTLHEYVILFYRPSRIFITKVHFSENFNRNRSFFPPIVPVFIFLE